MDNPEIFSFVYPRRSSDFFLNIERSDCDGQTLAISGVMDTIGKPSRRRTKRIVKRLQSALRVVLEKEEPQDLDTLDALFREQMAEANAATRENKKQKEVFGFCFAFAVRHGRSMRIHWMGDCRAYCFEPRAHTSAAGAPCSVECITRDNNRLSTKMLEIQEDEEQEHLVLLKNEMLELSRQLTLYLGIGDDARFAEALAQQAVDIQLPENAVLLLTTDGFFMPVLRHAVADAGFKLTPEMFYLEQWLQLYIDNGDYFQELEGMDVWRAFSQDIKKACLRYTRIKHRYRDDMAVIFIG